MGTRLGLLVAMVSSSALARPPLRDGEGFATRGGVRVWYRVEGGSRPGVPILIIHGGPGETARPFERTIGPLLAMNRPVVYTDYRGVGRSQRPEDPKQYSFEHFVDDDEAIRKQLGIEQWVVFGHSNGGATAISYALRAPGAVRGLVLCDPLLSPRDLEMNMAHKVNGLPKQAAKLRAILLSGETLQKRFFAMQDALEPGWPNQVMFVDPANGALLDTMQGQLSDQLGGKSLMSKAVFDGFVNTPAFFEFDAYAHVGRLTLPVLVLVGQQDNEISVDNSAMFAASLQAGRFVAIPQAGHFPFLEQTAPTANAIEGFLKEALQPPSKP